MSSFDSPGSFPYGTAAPPAQPPARLSRTALISCVVAALSPLGVCLCYPTLIGSGIALILGHIAIYRIWRSGGQQWGNAFAAIALLISYPLLGLGIVWLSLKPFADMPQAQRTPAQIRLKEAESKVFGDSQGIAHGNTPQAKELAETFSLNLKELRDGLFTDSKSKIKLSGGNFVTYCHLEEGRCVFVVHAPDLRHFADDAKESLAELAWAVGKSVAQEELEDGDQLAVGLKGVLLYGAVMTGQIGLGEEPKITKDSDDLLPFFAPPKPTAEDPSSDRH